MAALNEQQKYLLSRIPSRYDIKDASIPDTTEVKHARKVIEAHDKKTAEHRCERSNKFNKSLTAAREAIYFKKPDEALALVRALEAEFPKKCTC